MREGGEAAVERALAWLVARATPTRWSPAWSRASSHAAFNMTVLGMLLGTPLEPDLAGHVLLLEEVSEHMYATDRALFHITGQRQSSAASPGSGSAGSATSGPTIPDFGEDDGDRSSASGARGPASPISAAPTSATTRPIRWCRSAVF